MQQHGVDLLTDLALILCVAAVTTMLFQRLRQPVVLGYLLAGVVVGPHLPVPLFVDDQLTRTLSELGVILLMFSIGLEFRLRKLVKVVPTAGVVAVIECSLMVWLGYLVARAFGWTGYQSLFAGAAVAISSTTIIARAFAEQRVGARLSDLVFGVLIVEDLIAIVLVAVLTGVASGKGLSASALAVTLGKLAGFLAALLVGGMLIVPRLIRAVVRLHRDETTVVAGIGIAFAFALLARSFGYSVALGAFLAGALVSESGAGKIVEHRIEPVRDVFAAVFFVSVGMLIDPVVVWHHAREVLVLTVVVIGGKLIGVSVGGFVAGYGVRTSVQAAFSLGQIGEFSFIIAGVGLALGVTGDFLYPIAVAISALTTLLTPWEIRLSGRFAAFVDRRLPHTLQTYAALYGAWVQGLRATPEHKTAWARIRRLVVLLLLDVALLAAIVIVVSLARQRLLRLAGEVVRLHPSLARALLFAATIVLIAPFILGAVRMARALGAALAVEALPTPACGARELDLAAAPRRALLVTLQIAILLVVGVPVVAVTQPFMPGVPGMVILLLGASLLIVPLWRSATNLQGHVRAGAQVILEALAAQSGTTTASAPAASQTALPALLPGLGNAIAVPIATSSPAVGRTLKQINMRGLTGATVIAIDRDAADVIYPTGDETLRAGDALIVTGTSDAVAAAQELVAPPGTPAATRTPPT